MKTTKQSIVKALMVIILAFGASASANAQLGGLVNKAKKAAENVVQKKVQETQVDMVRQQDAAKKMNELRKERAPKEKAKQDELGQTGKLPAANLADGDVDFYLNSGQRFGIYHTKTKILERFLRDPNDNNKWISFRFNVNDDGTIVTEKGVTTGIINRDGSMRSNKTDDVSIDNDSFIYWKGTRVGSVNPAGEIRAFGDVIAYYYSDKPVDPKIATYLGYCDYLDNKTIGDYLKIRKQAILTPGSLNDEYHDAALASIKRRFSNVQDVVITSNEWRIVRDDLGNIISRVCDGWYIIPNGTGRRAISYCWKQNYMGGGQYDKLVEAAANGFDPIDLE